MALWSLGIWSPIEGRSNVGDLLADGRIIKAYLLPFRYHLEILSQLPSDREYIADGLGRSAVDRDRRAEMRSRLLDIWRDRRPLDVDNRASAQ